MKKHLILILPFCILLSCQSRDEKIKRSITAYQKSVLAHPDTYKPISFGRSDSAFQSYYDSEEGIEQRKRLDSLTIAAREFFPEKWEAPGVIDRKFAIIDSLYDYRDTIARQMERKAALYKGEFIGYKIKHKYDAMPFDGGKSNPVEVTFYLSPDLDSVWLEPMEDRTIHYKRLFL